MYLGVDIGGTKTIIASLNKDGQIIKKVRFPTDHNYDAFIVNLKSRLAELDMVGDFKAVVAVPGLIDRHSGVVHALGNLDWHNKPIRNDISAAIGHSVEIENDARLGGLSEAQLLLSQYHRVLFVTISTGIGGALIINGQIDRSLEDMEMGKMPLLYDGSYKNWEDFAGGRGVVTNLGQQARQIRSDDEWREVAEPIAYGLSVACSFLQPEAIVLGGSVGAYANKYSSYIKDFLKKRLHPVIRQPDAILQAQRPDDAVIYGCYDLARQQEKSHD